MELKIILIKITILISVYFLGLHFISHFKLSNLFIAAISFVTTVGAIKISAPLYKEE